MQTEISKASPNRLLQILRVANFLNAILLGVGGVFVFIPIPTSPTEILSALYVIFFALLLTCFECHLSRFDVAVAKYFGFMFTWQGRVLFFLFVGILSFGLGTVGIVAGIVTCVNVIFNVYVLRFNDGSRRQVEAQQNELRAKAMQGVNVSIDMAAMGREAAVASVSAAKTVQAVSSGAAGATAGGSAYSTSGAASPPAGNDAPGNPWQSV